MIHYHDLLLYGFWQKSDSEEQFIVYGVKKRVLLSTVISQLVLACIYLFLVFTYSFEETSFFLILLFGTTFISIFLLQRSIHWMLYHTSSGEIEVLSKGLKAPEEIKGQFTMNKKNFLEKSGFHAKGTK